MNRLGGCVLGAVVSLAAMIALQQAAFAHPCERDSFEGVHFFVCTVEPEASDLRLFWKDADGQAHRHFSSVARALPEEDRRLAFAINAGMYMADFSPIGLYIENGRELRAVNTRVIEGPPAQVPNFYKKPNGVFFLHETGAGVLSTEAFLDLQAEVQFATQSGPMLVIDNELHPAFIEGSTDRTRRSGVGVCENGVVRFALSDGRVNFHHFARLFRDRLGCPNALFLDGGQGAGIYAPALNRNDRSWHGGFGPIIGLVE